MNGDDAIMFSEARNSTDHGRFDLFGMDKLLSTFCGLTFLLCFLTLHHSRLYKGQIFQIFARFTAEKDRDRKRLGILSHLTQDVLATWPHLDPAPASKTFCA